MQQPHGNRRTVGLPAIVFGAAALSTLGGCFMDGYPGPSPLDANGPDRDAQVRADDASPANGAGPRPEDDGGASGVDAATDAAIDAMADASGLPPSCSGAPLSCSAACTGTESCAPACLENATCDNQCGSSQSCNNVCPAGSVCDFDCGLSPDCRVLCVAGSVCTVHTVDGPNAMVTCERTADCELYCDSGFCTFQFCGTTARNLSGGLSCPPP